MPTYFLPRQLFPWIGLIELLVLALPSSGTGQEPLPFGAPPELVAVESEDFETDPGIFEIGGSAHWQPGHIQLSPDSTATSTTGHGAWIQAELDIAFPQLDRDHQQSHLDVRLHLELGPDAMIRFSQKLVGDEATCRIFILDRSEEPDAASPWTPIATSDEMGSTLPSGKWLIVYRYGDFAITGPGGTIEVLGAIKSNGAANINHIQIHSTGATHQLNRVAIQSTKPVVLNSNQRATKEKVDQMGLEALDLFRKGDTNAAKVLTEKAAKLCKSSFGEYIPQYSTCLSNLVGICHARDEIEESHDVLVEAQRIVSKVKGTRSSSYANVIGNLAVIQKALGMIEESRTNYEQAVLLNAEIAGKQSQAYLYSTVNLGDFYSEIDEQELAEDCYREAQVIAKDLLSTKHPLYAQILRRLATAKGVRGDRAGQKQILEEALIIFEATSGSNHPDYGKTLAQLSKTNLAMGLANLSLQQLTRALEILEKTIGRKHRVYADYLSDLAFLHYKTGDYERSRPLFLEALEIKREVVGEEHPVYGYTLAGLGELYSELEQFDRAERVIIQARDIFQKHYGDSHSLMGYCLNLLGGVSFGRDDYESAIEFYLGAVAIQETVDPFMAARTSMQNLASCYVFVENFEQAETWLNKSLEIVEYTSGAESLEYANVLATQAELFWARSQLGEAIENYYRVLELTSALLGDDHPAASTYLQNLATLHFMQEDDRLAIRLAERALNIATQNTTQFASILSSSQQRSYITSIRSALDLYLSLTGRSSSSEMQQAYARVCHWKGIATIRERQYRQLASNPQTADILDQLRNTAADLSYHLQQRSDSADWKSRLSELREHQQANETQLVSSAGDDFRRAWQTPDLQTIADALGESTVLVDFIEYSRAIRVPEMTNKPKSEVHVTAFIVRNSNATSSNVQMVDLGSAAKIRAAIKSWRRVMLSETERQSLAVSNQLTDAGQEVRQLIWDPLLPVIKNAETILVSASGTIAQIPLQALPGKSPDKYLIEEHRLAYVPLPRLIAELDDRSIAQSSGSLDALLVGDINYDKHPVQSAYRVADGNESVEVGFARLEGTRAEIEEISKLVQNPTVLKGPEATEAKFLDSIAQHQIVHVATHGFFRLSSRASGSRRDSVPSSDAGDSDPDDASEADFVAGLAFAGANRSDTASSGNNDGILYADEISVAPFENVELAVLSACETGLGQESDGVGEGLIGLQRAFQVSGVDSTIASMWKVNDVATQRLMVRFYHNWMVGGMSKLDALREAQTWMLRNPVATDDISRGEPIDIPHAQIVAERDTNEPGTDFDSHPRYWAAWVLSGDWR